jgi:mismatch-specific thymine-DNA glycosylase
VDDVRLPEHGFALTNIAERATREAAELTALDYARGRKRLARTIATIRPAVVAFVGSTAYRQFFGRSSSSGPGAKPERVSGAAVFVVPNPSGRNAAFPRFVDKLTWYRRLRQSVTKSQTRDRRRRPEPARQGQRARAPRRNSSKDRSCRRCRACCRSGCPRRAPPGAR